MPVRVYIDRYGDWEPEPVDGELSVLIPDELYAECRAAYDAWKASHHKLAPYVAQLEKIGDAIERRNEAKRLRDQADALEAKK